jgi:ubiquinone/menaquinone biosynthesis C-methylase UbiE
MDTRQAYNAWAEQYDTNINKTRDLEGAALRTVLSSISFNSCLEVGCGTGKNTVWLIEKTNHITAVDLSEEMLTRAREKVNAEKVQFKQADITTAWTFTDALFDLVSFSLVLEHIENLDHIFNEVSRLLNPGGYVYIGELHPFKQYTGSKARFDTATGVQVVECFNHHVSDFVRSAGKYGLSLVNINEYFDDDNRNEIPRILTLLFRKA